MEFESIFATLCRTYTYTLGNPNCVQTSNINTNNKITNEDRDKKQE